MRALVTGGAGFIGSNLVHRLSELGWVVDVVDDLSNGHYEFLSGLNVKSIPVFMLQKYEDEYEKNRQKNQILFFESDFENEQIFSRIKRGYYDVVFHLAANPRVEHTVKNPARTTDVNVTRTMSLIEAIRDSMNKPRLVFSSTCAVYGDAIEIPTTEHCEKYPLSPYGLQKSTVEDFLRMSSKLYGIDSVCLRYFNVYGPMQLGDSPYSTVVSAWCNKVKNDEPLRSDGDGEQTRDMIYVGDVVNANVFAAIKKEKFEGDVINIGTGIRVSNNYILNLFKNNFAGLKVVNAPVRPGDVRDTQADNHRAYHKLGWKPQISFEDGLKLTWKWWELKN
jgi:UDP-glucose 4-epimerase